MPEQYSTVTTSIQKLLPLCADWLQHRSHRLCLKKAAMLIFVDVESSRLCQLKIVQSYEKLVI
jgi:hypothetical protein